MARMSRAWLPLSIAAAIFLSGCATGIERVDSVLLKEHPLQECGVSRDEAIARVDMRRLLSEAARSICAKPVDPKDALVQAPTAYVVPDMVDIQTYVPSKLGISMGELLRSSIFNICKVPVRQVEVSSAIKFDSSGMVILSRDLDQLKQKAFPAETAVIGTYHLQSNRLTVVVRRVSLDNSLISAIATREARWRCASPGFGTPSFSVSIH